MNDVIARLNNRFYRRTCEYFKSNVPGRETAHRAVKRPKAPIDRPSNAAVRDTWAGSPRCFHVRLQSIMSYRCSSCGEIHEGLPDLGFNVPDPWFNVPEDERANRIKLDADLCVIDDQEFYIRGVVQIPI